MVYGHYYTTSDGTEHFFVEGCSHCQMSTGGQHEPNCPLKDVKVADKQARLEEIRECSHRELGDAWRYLANH